MSTTYDAIVVGGGLVGSAIAYGLQRKGLSTVILDEGDIAFRAARGNFGLVWVQSKGTDFPPYAQWTWKSAESWAELNAEILDITGDDIGYSRPGGGELCITEKELESRREKMLRLQSHAPHFKFEMLDHKAMRDLIPDIGPEVVGGCYSPADGHANPLYLLRGLHQSLQAKGGALENGGKVTAINRQGGTFSVSTAKAKYQSAKLVLAAGLGTKDLATMIGMNVPIRPQRGQILVTERLKPFLSLPLSKVRQTSEGSVQLGDSQEEVGFDEGTTSSVMNRIAHRAATMFPHLKHARIVRAWGALRVMSPDGYPVYVQSEDHLGAFAAVCHSGVTLAAAHALHLAGSIADGTLPDELAPMSAQRFTNA